MIVEPWEEMGLSYNEWFRQTPTSHPYWLNKHRQRNVESYLWRVTNYERGLNNEHVLKSTFGKADIESILKEINKWFQCSIGAYTKIQYNG